MFPTINLYNGADHPVKFREDRSKKEFIKFAKKFIRAEVIELWDGNLRKEIHGDEDREKLAWVVFYDFGEGALPSHNEMLRLANEIDGLANVAIVDCETSKLYCQMQKVEQVKGQS